MGNGVLAGVLVDGADDDVIAAHLGHGPGGAGLDDDLLALARLAAGQLGALGHVVALGHHRQDLLGLQLVRGVVDVALVDLDLAGPGLGLLDLDDAVDLGDDRLALGDARLEQLLDAGQTLGDVGTGHTTGVEGTHRQLGAGLADRLGGDDADGLTDLDHLAGGQVAAVAAAADALARDAGQDRADLDLGQA